MDRVAGLRTSQAQPPRTTKTPATKQEKEVTTHKFSELRDKMSPERKARNKAAVAAEITKIDRKVFADALIKIRSSFNDFTFNKSRKVKKEALEEIGNVFNSLPDNWDKEYYP